MKSLLETLLAIAWSAGEVLLEMYGAALAVQYKGPGDPVTAADRRANALLVERLEQAFPGLPVVAEESDPAAFHRFREAPQVFFVDPLDGTQEFLARNGEFAVMIGLLEGRRPVAGVVHAPAMNVAWAGAAGLGAWKVEQASGPWGRVHVSATDELARARLLASRSHRTVRLRRALAALHPCEAAAMGSAGLKGAQVAQGSAGRVRRCRRRDQALGCVCRRRGRHGIRRPRLRRHGGADRLSRRHAGERAWPDRLERSRARGDRRPALR